MPRVYLVSKRLDPLLGVVSGLWAYHMYEKKVQREPGQSLPELVQWKYAKWQAGATQTTPSTAQPYDSTQADADAWREINAEMARQSQKQ